MEKSIKQSLFWIPRVMSILFVLFLSMFALDIFDMNLGFWGTIVGLIMHLIPSIVLAIAIALAWKREWIGAVLFIGWALFYLVTARGFDWSVYVSIAGIPALIGALYLVGWAMHGKLRDVSKPG